MKYVVQYFLESETIIQGRGKEGEEEEITKEWEFEQANEWKERQDDLYIAGF